MSLLRRRALIRSVGTPIPPIPTSGLIARWDGGSILDTSGSANTYDGTLSTNPPTLVNGINGEANGSYNFVSADLQYIDFGSIIDIKGVAKVSISTWLNKVASKWGILSDLIGDPQEGIGIGFDTQGRLIGWVRDGANSSLKPVGTFPVDEWINVVIVYDGTQVASVDRITLYVNTIDVGGAVVGTIPTSLPSNTQPFRLGEIGGIYSDSQIAQTLIYDRVLIQSDVNQIYAQKT